MATGPVTDAVTPEIGTSHAVPMALKLNSSSPLVAWLVAISPRME